jgi:DNA polymerase V
MGAPWFQIKHLQEQAGLVALSANFALYGDMSDRMMSLAGGLGHRQEIYSIDESFVDLSGIPGNLVDRAHLVRARIGRWIGIPTCIGIAPTKTLAKLANHIAKNAERKPGSYPAHLAQVCHLGALSLEERQALLATTDVGEVWGVGRQLSKQLKEAGVHTALDLAKADPMMVQRRWTVVLSKTVRELNGEPCLALEEMPSPKQQIACTRSFGHPVTELAHLLEAISHFTGRAAEKLRRQNSLAGQIMVFIRTSPFRKQDLQYSAYRTVPLPCPSADTSQLTQWSTAIVRHIFRPGYKYAKAGVMLMDLQPAEREQFCLELDPEEMPRPPRLMEALDTINQRWGRGTLQTGRACVAAEPRPWQMKQLRMTPRYTTDWDELMCAR